MLSVPDIYSPAVRPTESPVLNALALGLQYAQYVKNTITVIGLIRFKQMEVMFK
jgi:hypothetical protein